MSMSKMFIPKSLGEITDCVVNVFYEKIWKTVTELTPGNAFALAMFIEVGLTLYTVYYGYPSSRPDREEQLGMELTSGNPIDVKRQEAVNKVKPLHMWNGVAIFFPDVNPSSPDSPTNQLIWFFRQAKFRIQLCIYLSSYPPIENVILEKIAEGVLVQVITDYDTSISHNNFNITRWKQRGTEVKLKPNGHLMHNKFAIIDEQAVLTGSLNWTTQGFTVNNENVIVTTDCRIVEKYMQEYNKIWASCDK